MLYFEQQSEEPNESNLQLPLVLEPQPEGGYLVTCPLLPELITEGETVQDALQNANDALAAIVEALRELKRPLPSALLEGAIISLSDKSLRIRTLPIEAE